MIDSIIKRLVWVYAAGSGLLVLSLTIELSLWSISDGANDLQNSQFIETISHSTILIILITIAFFLFRPALRELKETHNTLAQREQQLSRVLSTAIEGYAVIDPSTYRYLEVNNALCEMLGYTPDEMLGKTPLDFCAPESHGIFQSKASTIPNTDTRQYQVVMLHKNGDKVYTQYNANTVRDDNKTAKSAFAFITNITDIQHAQIELEIAKDKAEQATELKDKFVSLIAHDLRNPIGAIRGYSELLKMDLSNNLTDDQKDSLDHIHRQCDDLLKLINDLLDLSRLQSGSIDLNKTFWDAQYLVDNITRRVEMQAETKNITVLNDVDKHSRVFGDQILLGQVLQNLISNAIKFSHEGSAVRVFTPKGAPTTIAVQDTGVGIDEDALNTLFTLEEKNSTLGTAGEVGSGFGLPLSAHIIAAHEGSIRIDSQHGKGSTFYIDLPEIVPQILIVDDDDSIRLMVKTLLTDLQVQFFEADDGLRALKHVQDNGMPHLIITDLRMPNLDGIGLMQKLTDIYDDEICPIIAMTADKDSEVRSLTLSAGAYDFVPKPIQSEELVPRVRHVVG